MCAAALVSLAGCSSAGVDSGAPESTVGSTTGSAATEAGGVSVTEGPYFPVQVGNSWVYRIDYGSGSSAVSATDSARITKVVAGTDGVSTVTVEHSLHAADGSHQDIASTTDLLVRPDGSVAAPPLTLTAGDYSAALPTAVMVLPSLAQLASGQPIVTTADVAVTAAGSMYDQNITVTATTKGTSSVTVPAGTFDATVVSHVLELAPSVLPIPITITATSYLVKGVGLVKSTIPAIMGMSGDTTITLLSFSKG